MAVPSKKRPADSPPTPRKSPRKRPANSPSKLVEGASLVASSGGGANMNDELAGEQIVLFAGVPGLERVKVFREDERTKKPVFHGNLSVDEATVDRVTELFGGGKYVLRATTRDGNGAEVFATSRTLAIPGPYKPVTGPLPGVGVAVPVAGAPVVAMHSQGSPSEIRELMESALAGKLMDLLKPTAPVPVAPPMDWAKMLAAVGTLITAVTPLLESRNKGEPMLMTLVQQLRDEVQSVKNAPTPQQSSMRDLLSTIRGMAELKDVLGGGTGGEPKEEGGDKMWDLAAKALAVFTGQQPPGQPVGTDPAIAGHIAPPTMAPWQQLLTEYAPRLVDSAQRAIEAELVAELVARYVPEQQRGTLMELVQQPNTAELIVSVVPAMANYPAWLAQFVAACKEELLPTEESDDGNGE